MASMSISLGPIGPAVAQQRQPSDTTQGREQRIEMRRNNVVILRRRGLRALVRSVWDRALWRSGLR